MNTATYEQRPKRRFLRRSVATLLALVTFASVMAIGMGTAAAQDQVSGKSCFTTSYATQCHVWVTNTSECGLNPSDNFSFNSWSVPSVCATAQDYWCVGSRWESTCDVTYYANGVRYIK